MTVLAFLWHAFEWLELIGVLVIAAWAMSYNVRVDLIGPMSILTGQMAADKDARDSDRLADALMGDAALVWRVVVRLIALVGAAFAILAWPLTRTIRALDARDWELRRRRPR